MASVEFVQHEGQKHPELWFGDGQPLGADVYAILHDSDLTVRERSVYARQAMADLQDGLRRLYFSPSPEDRDTVDSINQQFKSDTSAQGDDTLFAHVSNDVLGWLAAAEVSEVADFLCENVRQHALHQDALGAVAEALNTEVLERVERLVGDGYFPRTALPLYEASVCRTPIMGALDSFEAGGMYAEGYMSEGRIYTVNLFADPISYEGITQDLSDMSMHERTHGALFERSRERKATGSTAMEMTIVEEAFVAHWAMAVTRPDKDLRQMLPPPTEQGVYFLERKLLGLEMNYGPRPIDQEELSAACFAPADAFSGERVRN